MRKLAKWQNFCHFVKFEISPISLEAPSNKILYARRERYRLEKYSYIRQKWAHSSYNSMNSVFFEGGGASLRTTKNCFNTWFQSKWSGYKSYQVFRKEKIVGRGQISCGPPVYDVLVLLICYICNVYDSRKNSHRTFDHHKCLKCKSRHKNGEIIKWYR